MPASGDDRQVIVHMIGNAHIDPIWLWTLSEGRAEVLSSYRTAVSLLRTFDGYVFTSGATVTYRWVAEDDPALLAEIRDAVAAWRRCAMARPGPSISPHAWPRSPSLRRATGPCVRSFPPPIGISTLHAPCRIRGPWCAASCNTTRAGAIRCYRASSARIARPSLSLLRVSPDDVVLTVAKMAEDGECLIVRGYETAGRPARVVITSAALGQTWIHAVRPHEVWTLALPLDGGAPEPLNLLEEPLVAAGARGVQP